MNAFAHVKIDQGNIILPAEGNGIQHGLQMGVGNKMIKIAEEQILVCMQRQENAVFFT